MITVLGASGFIGSHLVEKLRSEGREVFCPGRNESWFDRDLGDVIYCIGLTADFRSRPFDTVTAHICLLNELLTKARFSSLLYLSSTRVYIHSRETVATESDKLIVDPLASDDLYTLSKITGERLCLSGGRNCKIARLSNVIGPYQNQDVFLMQILNSIRENGHVQLQQSLQSAKDYIGIDEVVEILLQLAHHHEPGIYNVASGKNTSNKELLDALAGYFSFSVATAEKAPAIGFPVISNQKITDAFGFVARPFSEQLPLILKKNI